MKVSEGTRTPDRLDHNQELYQLSYAHRGELNLPLPPPWDWACLTIGACGSGFGRAMQMGAGMGIAGDLINSIF